MALQIQRLMTLTITPKVKQQSKDTPTQENTKSEDGFTNIPDELDAELDDIFQ